MNGVHPPDNNRFRELDLSSGKRNRNKRPRAEDFIPLPETPTNQKNQPRYLVAATISIKENVQVPPLASHNVFQVERGLNHISRERLEVKELKSGDLLIKVANANIAEKFLKASYIDCIPVKITLHKTLNTTQGRIFSRKIIEIPEEELFESLKEQKIIEVRKINKKENGKIVATGAAVITFDLFYRPEFLNLGWERIPVNEYIPSPMKCLNCQKLGHTRKWCKSVEQCRECGYTEKHEICTRKYCVNCQVENHHSYDPECPTFWKHKSVNYIRVSRRCTARDAWKIFNENPTQNLLQPFRKNSNKKPSYAQIVNNNATTTKQNSTSTVIPANSTTQDQNKATSKPDKSHKPCSTTNIAHAHNNHIIQPIQPQLNIKTTDNQQTHATIRKAIFEISPHNKNQPILSSITTKCTENNIDSLKDDYILGEGNETFLNDSFRETIAEQILSVEECTTPQKKTNSMPTDECDSPCTQIFKKFPQLNVLITPNTFRSTQQQPLEDNNK